MNLNSQKVAEVYETLGTMLDQYPQSSAEYEVLDLLASTVTYILNRKLTGDFASFCDEIYQPLTPEQIEYLKSQGLEYERIDVSFPSRSYEPSS